MIRKLRKHNKPVIIFTILCFVLTVIFSLVVSIASFFVQ
jgi:hypothetical protein